jgi:HYR domain
MRRLTLAVILVCLIGVPLAFGSASAPPPIRADSVTAEATSAAGATVTFNVKAFDPATGNAIPASCDPGGSGTGDFTVTASYPLGSTTVVCTATLEDASQAQKTITVTIQDTTAPSVTPPAPVTDSSADTGGKAVSYGGATAVDIVDGSLTPACNPPSGSTFAIGTTTVTCTATDNHGNTGSATFTVTVTFTDTTAPAFTPNPPPNISQETSNPAGTTVTYSVAATDNSGAASVTCNPASGSTFPVGPTTVSCTAEDAAHNQATASFTVTVTFVDTAPPAFSNVPANITAEANSPGGSNVNYTTPTASDAVDGPAVVTCTPPPGSMFPLGSTSVTCSASDAHGNTSTASFSVAVVDTTKPTLIVPADSAAYADTPSGLTAQGYGAAQFLAAAHATDLVDPHPTVSNNAGALFGVGVNVVTFTASDVSGNTVSKTATLEVRPLPPAGTPPLPLPPAPKPPANVTNFKAEAGDAQVRLSWQIPNGVDHVVVTRTLTAGGDSQVVYTGKATSFIDRGVVNGLEYRYLIVSVAPNDEQSAGVAAVALPKSNLLRSPKDGARLKKPPKLLWVKNTEAAYYNVQLFRGTAKILSIWPVKTALTLKRTWKYQGRRYTLTRGVYRWYVWPGFGPRSAVDYGESLGSRSFEIMR